MKSDRAASGAIRPTVSGDVTDGTSTTLLVGERPPGGDFFEGWWYAGIGMEGTGAPDFLLGAAELHTEEQVDRIGGG